jgi:hypothetical protein
LINSTFFVAYAVVKSIFGFSENFVSKSGPEG